MTHYEQVHSRLIASQARPFALSYSRSYLDYDDPCTIVRDPSVLAQVRAGAQPFDVLTEVMFRDRAGLEGFFSAGREEKLAVVKRTDEEKFLNRDVMQVFIVTDRRSTTM